ncbi:membrane-bound PQQ-dependent dehydrogenase, glucose/quinate/shikimate family [Salinisphaera sp. Q1T1-3]|uniref:membrane-bound PQQ-dependent dehydrogenase, glucose/quinate/shikimate family n=1 Tax=Salinisphaera sp. Q1T1-3 TaxID=2321229 RepID=UPI000E71FD08|nr:membrane-bound PQQ-dependent dehydrogenase, glucose/quinate/shikimate family [Salinisphaera sp. Q1T1-3]RJS94090.1 membrane-bound PQQ-dependent dehydrogenase, glucose/quinate/shikimate family [Salinisphaera sp. Q1T1-3]
MPNSINRSPSRLFPAIVGILILVIGLALAIGGFKLVGVGGSWYYLIAGIVLVIDGVLLIAARSAGLWLYGLFLLASIVWSIYEVGLSWWDLVPRLALFAVIGLVMLLPWLRRPLAARGSGHGNGMGTPVLLVGVIAAFGLALVSQFVPAPTTITGSIPERDHPVDPAYAADADWPSYGGTDAGTHYSSLDDITTGNVDQLKVAWKIRTGDLPGPNHPAEITDEDTPLKVNDTLYVCTPHSQVLALDPATGKTKWHYNTNLSQEGAKNFSGWPHMTCRGVAYAEVGNAGQSADADTQATATPVADPQNTQDAPATNQCPRRIFLPTADARLIALNADTGQRCADFGNDGSVDLAANQRPFKPGGYYSTSPPIVADGLVIIGGHVTDNSSTNEPSGVVRAYDVHTGKLVWNWDSGNPEETKPIAPDAHYVRNSPNVWAPMSVDHKNKLIYLPLGNAPPDQFGGNRSAATEKLSSSLVALHVDTGQMAWHQQLTHHDLWDMDPPAQPQLTDLTTESGMQPVVIQPTKQGQLYVFNRVTGKPVVPIHEQAAPQGTVDGDHAAPTQPHSELNLVPPQLTGADMWGASPIDQMMCRIRFNSLRYEGQYTPPSLQGSISYPGNVGVMNWGGVAINPADQSLFAVPKYLAFVLQLVPAEKARSMEKADSENGGLQPNTGAPYAVKIGPLLSPLALPCQAPSWGDVAGIDLQTRKIAWRHPNGTARDQTPIVPVPLPVGVPALGGPITTAGGVAFESGTLDYYLRAYNVHNGDKLWQARLPAGGNATPMTYSVNGQQYVVVVAGGHGTFGTKFGDYVIAYKLPDDSKP